MFFVGEADRSNNRQSVSKIKSIVAPHSMGNCSGKNKREKDDMEQGPPSEESLMKKAELKSILDADSIKREVSLSGAYL